MVINRKISMYVLVGIFTIAFIRTIILDSTEERSIKENNHITIAKVVEFANNRSFNNYYYIYFFKNKKYSASEDLSYFGRSNCVDKYYIVEISTKNPEYSKIYLDKEVTDSITIVNAGFTLE